VLARSSDDQGAKKALDGVLPVHAPSLLCAAGGTRNPNLLNDDVDNARDNVGDTARKARRAAHKAARSADKHYDWLGEVVTFLICVAIALIVFLATSGLRPGL
jgi:hypothetical protein